MPGGGILTRGVYAANRAELNYCCTRARPFYDTWVQKAEEVDKSLRRFIMGKLFECSSFLLLSFPLKQNVITVTFFRKDICSYYCDILPIRLLFLLQ